MANPTATADTEGEYLEVYNRTGTGIDLNGFILKDDGADAHTINASVVVPAHGYATLAASSAPGFTPDYVYAGFTLANGGDEVVLTTAGGVEILRLAYASGFAAAGASAELKHIARPQGGVTVEEDYRTAEAALGNGDLGSPGVAGLTSFTFTAILAGEGERPTPVASMGQGTLTLTLDGDQATIEGDYDNLTSNKTASHLHGPATEAGTAGVLLGIGTTPGNGVAPEGSFNSTPVTLNAATILALTDGMIYVNVHSANFGGGELRGQLLEPTEQTVTAGAGWRLLSAPVSDLTVYELASQNLVQGTPDQFATSAANLYTGYDESQPSGSRYVASTGRSEMLSAGQGVLWYLYDNDQAFGLSAPHPFSLVATGTPTSTDVTVPLNAGAGAFTMLGNPFDQPIEVNDFAVGANGVQTNVFLYDPATGFETRAGAEDVAVWQGFFVENSTTPQTTLTLPASARRSTPTAFVGREALAAQLKFSLTGEASDGARTVDNAAVLRFEPDAHDGWDLHDGSKPTPLAARWASLSFRGENARGESALKAVESRAPWTWPRRSKCRWC